MSRQRVRDIEFEIKRSHRKTADIVIERDGRVLVRAPKSIKSEHIHRIVEAKSYWIYKNLAEWKDLNATRILREYSNGEGFLYLGRSYRLLLVSRQQEALMLRDGRFCLRRDLAEKRGKRSIQAAFREFYSARGLERIVPRVRYFAPKIEVVPKRIAIKDLGHRWASSSPNGNLAFHWKCTMAPPKIIDYIIVHELCHFRHADHSDAFWNEVDKVLPDYRERKEWLKKNGAAMDV